MTSPPSWNQTAAAVTRATARISRPTPSRRCSGSSSRALRPILRATPPIAWATASQTAATPRKIVSKKRATGPRPLRTARGAGRRFAVEPRFFCGDFRAFFLAAGRRPSCCVLRVVPAALLDGVLLLREPGGEDVRVAMVTNVGDSHSCHTDHRGACCSQGFGADRKPCAVRGVPKANLHLPLYRSGTP